MQIFWREFRLVIEMVKKIIDDVDDVDNDDVDNEIMMMILTMMVTILMMTMMELMTVRNTCPPSTTRTGRVSM